MADAAERLLEALLHEKLRFAPPRPGLRVPPRRPRFSRGFGPLAVMRFHHAGARESRTLRPVVTEPRDG